MARRTAPAPHCSIPQHTGVTRRDWLGWGLALAAAPLATARAQAPFPSKPVQLIVPWPAGGQTDLTVRILAEEAESLLGQPVVVINKPGAAGTLVAPLLKAAEPDGHTIGQVPITVYRHALMNRVPWDPVNDLSPIIQVSGVSFGLLVPAASPFRHVSDMIDWALKRPGELIMGSTGIGTTAHLAMEEILLQHNVRYVHVPYKGTADQMLAIAAGQIMAGVNSTGFAPWVERGQMRLLATFNASRNPRWPEVPTMRELGYPQAVYTSPWGLAAPAGTPEHVIQKLHEVFHRAMTTERHTAALARYDQSLEYLGTREYRQSVLATVEREKKLLARLNLLAKPA
ncbi:Bug family tripartite tricarboxylate transporter substrate binding protein [Hydrogenophaga sp.]|uniref:Bug family tripartite tricarboxylate transporter substrate binding protein n=1 Tax=Hydrogenophaga sp. TaxID=1904254 RepID=UPI0035B4B877